MPYSKDPDAYPPIFAQLFATACERDFGLELPGKGEAVNFVHRLNAYRRAVLRAYPSTPLARTVSQVTVKAEDAQVKFSNKNKEVEQMIAGSGVELVEIEESGNLSPLSEKELASYESEVDIFRQSLEDDSNEER